MASLSENISLYEFCMKNQEYSELLNYWSENNSPLTPMDISVRSSQRIIWNKGTGDFQFSVYGMVHSYKDKLYGRKLVKNSLLDCNRDICKEWDYNRNEFGPEYYSANSHNEVFWMCKEHGSYSMPIHWRTMKNGRGCPLCNAGQSSYPEQLLFVYLSHTFKSTTNRFKIEGYEYDIYIPEIKLAIEYDGYPWHSGKVNTHSMKKESSR